MAVSTEKRYAALAKRLEEQLAEAQESVEISERDIVALTQDVADEGVLSAPADEGTDVADIERQEVVKRDQEERLNQIRAALGRMAAGTYGTCANCGKTIPIARLEALPWATLCIDCQAASER
jgi:RNA polymerase-binding transcription factor